MDARLKAIYERELQHLESHAKEFAESQRYRKIAQRLGLGQSVTVRDPFVEWLLDGFAYLSSRVQLKLEQQFPRFTQNLLSVVFPQLVAPLPSMAVVAFDPEDKSKALADGPFIRRGTPLRAQAAGRAVREVRYLTGRSVRLWPLKVAGAEYLTGGAAVRERIGDVALSRSGVELTLKAVGETVIPECRADEIDLFIAGPRSVTAPLYEALTARRAGAFALPADPKGAPIPLRVSPLGLEARHRAEGGPIESDALLPCGVRSYDGFRLLQEFFALPERFLFVRLSGLQDAFARADDQSLRIVFAFQEALPALRGRVTGDTFVPYCVPAVNLFPKQADDIRLRGEAVEYHILPDRGAPADFEIHTVTSVVARGRASNAAEFVPFFSTAGLGSAEQGQRFYALNREPRQPPVTSKGDVRLGDYRGSEVYLSLVDDSCVPFAPEFERISVKTLCTNRHLPLMISAEGLNLRAEDDLGCRAIRIVAGPSLPQSCVQEGRRLWDAVSHLSLNYLSLVDTEGGGGADALRQLLHLYSSESDVAARQLIDGLVSIDARQIAGRLAAATDAAGGTITPVSYGRGLEVTLRFGEGVESAPLLAAVLDRFLAGYAGVNSFTQTVLTDTQGQERCRWPTRSGTVPVL